MFDENYLKLKVIVEKPNIEFSKSLKKFEWDNLSELISYYPVVIELIEESENSSIINKIGYLDGYYFDIDYLYEHGLSIFDAFDMCSGDTAEAYHILFDKEENIKTKYESSSNNIFYLNRIYIEEAYRSHGYAKLLLNQLEDLIKYIAKLNIGLIVVYPQPFEKNNKEEKMIRNDKQLKAKLVELYKSVGFEETSNSSNYLVKIIN